MSKTYGTLQGFRGEATRRGGNDGVRVSCQSYDGSVIVSNWYDGETLKVRVGTNDDSSTSTGWGSNDFVGTFEDFKKLLKLADDIKSGRASVVHHREVK